MRNVLIMGAGGRDFHVFNTCYRDNAQEKVVAITAAQIPHIDDRRYPKELAGPLYPDGIPIRPEQELEALIAAHKVQHVVFAYSDVSLKYVAEQRARVERTGATFGPFDVDATMLRSRRPVVAVCAVRTGCGKSQTSRRVLQLLKELGVSGVALRHPMPYGDLVRQQVQRFASIEDLTTHDCTIEEMEEYEPHIRAGHVVYAGADYARILAAAEAEAQVVLWDGGNNDTPFLRPNLWITVADALRPGHELEYFPAADNFSRADVILINKIDSARPEDIARIEANARRLNPRAEVLRAASPVTVSDPELLRGKRALVIEDGPTLTHGGMKLGAGVVAAQAHGATLVDPRPYAVGEIAATFKSYPDTGAILPAMGYGAQQMQDLAQTIARADCDVVVVATPIDLGRIVKIDKPSVRVRYELDDVVSTRLRALLEAATRATPHAR